MSVVSQRRSRPHVPTISTLGAESKFTNIKSRLCDVKAMTHLILVVILAVLRSGLASICPNMCQCKRTNPLNYTAIQCENYPPSKLDSATNELTLLNITRPEFDEIVRELSFKLPHLLKFTVSHSALENLNVSLHSDTLYYVNLSGNRISNVEDFFLDNATRVHTVDISHNAIAAINNQTFRTCSLEILNLSANLIEVIEADSFSDSLKFLDLSTNRLTDLPSGIFAQLKSLQHLNLSRNLLSVVHEEDFELLSKLQQLDLSANQLTAIQLASLPSLSRLILSDNGKLGTRRELVATGQRLQTVEAVQTGLKQVPNALTRSVRTLRLAWNAIKTIRCGDLDSYPLLQLLDLNSNNLEYIEEDALGRLDFLSVLYLTGNRLKEIPGSLSEVLKVLHLERNEIGTVSNLHGLTALEVLLLNDNKITSVEEAAFSQMNALVTLDLSRNPIRTLEAAALSGSMALQVLRIANVAVDAPARDLSFPLPTTDHLITLDLAQSGGLARQLLADTAALAAARELQELDLSNTQLTSVRSDLLHFLPQLRTLRLDGNPLNCTHLEWLAVWMRRQDQQEYSRILCASPADIAGTPLVDLQEIDVNEIEATTLQSFEYSVTKHAEFVEIRNSSSTKMSRFSAGTTGQTTKIHSGLLFLAGGILGAICLFTMLAVRFARKRRMLLLQEEYNPQVNMPGVTELW